MIRANKMIVKQKNVSLLKTILRKICFHKTLFNVVRFSWIFNRFITQFVLFVNCPVPAISIFQIYEQMHDSVNYIYNDNHVYFFFHIKQIIHFITNCP